MVDTDLERYWRRRREIEERQNREIAEISAGVAELGASLGRLTAALQSMLGAMIARFEERERSGTLREAEASFLEYLRGVAGRLDSPRREAAVAAFRDELRALTRTPADPQRNTPTVHPSEGA